MNTHRFSLLVLTAGLAIACEADPEQPFEEGIENAGSEERESPPPHAPRAEDGGGDEPDIIEDEELPEGAEEGEDEDEEVLDDEEGPDDPTEGHTEDPDGDEDEAEPDPSEDGEDDGEAELPDEDDEDEEDPESPVPESCDANNVRVMRGDGGRLAAFARFVFVDDGDAI